MLISMPFLVAQNISEPIQLEQYLVIADYQKQNQSEISLLAGDIVEVIERNDNGLYFYCDQLVNLVNS